MNIMDSKNPAMVLKCFYNRISSGKRGAHGRKVMKDKYQKTIYACFIGYVVQAVVNNFVPLLFLTFEKT